MVRSVESEMEHFRSIPWCAKHLSRPNQVFRHISSREGQYATPHNLVTKTLNTPSTIPTILLFHDAPRRPDDMITELSGLITLGPDVAGHGGIAHGGLILTLLDEVSGELGIMNCLSGAISYPLVVTGYLNTKFIRPVPVPSTVFMRSWMERVEGRKFFFGVVIEDCEGVALASADALFVGMEKVKL